MKSLAESSLRGVLILLLYAGIASCTGTRTASMEAGGGEEPSEDLPQIIFLNYSIKKTPDNNIHIELINQIVAAGNLKPGFVQHSKPGGSDLECLGLDKDKRPLSTQSIPDPFKQRVEYLQEDGSLTTREISLDSTVFSVRMQLENASRFVAVKLSDSPGGTYLIINKIEEL